MCPQCVKNIYSYCGHAGVLDDMFLSTNITSDRQVERGWVAMHPFAESPAAQDQPQDLQHHNRVAPDYAGAAQDVPIQADVAPPTPVVVASNDDVHPAAGDPAPAFLDDVPHQGPASNGRAIEVLRQLALLYLNDPNSQVVTVRIGPGHDSEVTVDITLKLTNL